MAEDRIYSLPLEQVGNFQFDEQVVAVFPDMIARSVPGYASVLSMTAELAERFSQPGSQIYDIGCSLGAATLLIRDRVPDDCVIQAIDSSPSMAARLRELLDLNQGEVSNPRRSGDRTGCHVNVSEEDVRDVSITNASFAICNFTLQFIPPDGRSALLQKIFDGMLDGGALVLSEKVHFENQSQQQLMNELHHSFKRAHGYSHLEISQKRTALENTLLTDTIETHIQRLHAAGFQDVSLWFQCFNFVSILAIK